MFSPSTISSSPSLPRSLTRQPSIRACQLRVQQDITELQHSRMDGNCDLRITCPRGLSIQHNPSTEMHVTITPWNGVYARSCIRFSVTIPTNYPHSPPRVRCLTKLLHPQVNWRTGEVYIPLLTKSQWRPVLSLNTVFFALQLMLMEMNICDESQSVAMNHECLHLLRTDRQAFELLVKETLHGGWFFGCQWPRILLDDDIPSPHHSPTTTPTSTSTSTSTPSLSELASLSLPQFMKATTIDSSSSTPTSHDTITDDHMTSTSTSTDTITYPFTKRHRDDDDDITSICSFTSKRMRSTITLPITSHDDDMSSSSSSPSPYEDSTSHTIRAFTHFSSVPFIHNNNNTKEMMMR